MKQCQKANWGCLKIPTPTILIVKRKKETSNKGSNGQDMIEDKSVLVDGIEREEDSLAVCRANLLVAGSYSLGSRYSLGSQVKSVERTL